MIWELGELQYSKALVGRVGPGTIPIHITKGPPVVQAYARGGRTPRFGSKLPEHDEIPIHARYMPQADVSEAEPQKQAMGNDSVETREMF